MNFLAPDPIEISSYIAGTPAFMAPEQLDPEFKNVDERTDIFSLGGLLYAILTNDVPFNIEKFDSERTLIAPQDRSPQANIPESLSAVCIKAMNVNPEKRYQSVNNLKHEVELYLDGFATEAENASFIKTFKLLIARHRKICVSLFMSFFDHHLFSKYFCE